MTAIKAIRRGGEDEQQPRLSLSRGGRPEEEKSNRRRTNGEENEQVCVKCAVITEL